MSGIFSGGDELGSIVNPVSIVAFDTMAVVATVSLALTLGPAVFSANVHRSKAWHSMITTMMIFPLFYLLNVGSQFDNEVVPPIGLCILQAGFIYAGPPACTVSVLCLVTDMALGLRSAIYNGKRNKILMSALVVMPSIIFASVFFEAIVLVNSNRGVHFDSAHMFCESDDQGPQVKISAILTVISLALTLGMEVWAVYILYRNRSVVRNIRRLQTGTDLQLSVMLRLAVFSLAVSFAAGLGAVALPANSLGGAIWNIFLVTVPLLAALSFGTRRDIMSTYAFWKKGTKDDFRGDSDGVDPSVQAKSGEV
ncbi:hypothetical protein B0H11DRAFT_2004419 [Mycena galericulata]|nr:hypothetical protein B0H11DRAFT_2004419 [Mycena galericulata]